MGTSPFSPQDIRAAAGAHQELGPEYSDAVVASFLERVDQEIAARVAERLGTSAPQARPAQPPPARPVEPGNRRALMKGFAAGVASSLAVVLLVVGSKPGHHALLALLLLVLAFGAGALWASWRRAGRRAALRQAPTTAAADYRRLI
jgi:predicted lipid-binding transport protein (Tim44 family)